jgi:hypothetical protein
MTRDSQGGWKVRADHAENQPAYFAASRSFQAMAEWNSTHEVPISAVEINLPLLAMDHPVDDSSPRSFREAFEPYREGLPGIRRSG